MESQDKKDQAAKDEAIQTTPPANIPINPPTALPPKPTEEEEIAKDMNKAERVMARWAMVTAFGTLVSAAAICFQWYEMHTGGKDTTHIAQAAKDQADAAQQFADTADDINGNMDDAVEKLNAQAEASKKLAGQALAQANATRNLAQTSKDALESVQRAFVFASTGHGDPPVMSDGPPATVSIAVPFENSGSTPTQNLTAHINWIATPPGVGEDYFGDMLVNGAVPADTDTDAVLGPHSAGSTLNAVLPRDTFIQATKGQTSVRIWGWIKYRDIFKNTPRRLTEYCYHLRFSGKIVNDIPATYTLENCPTHNCSDEQCKDYKQRIAN